MSGEFKFIDNLLKPLANNNYSLDLQDDAAFIEKASNLVIATDSICEDIHFFAKDDPYLLAQKLLGVNLSDIAAMGSVPVYYTLNLNLTKNIDFVWLEKFVQGLVLMQQKYNITLIGGDTTNASSLSLSCTMFGETEGDIVRRIGAANGECIFVTGTIGDAFSGLQILKNGDSINEFLLDRYYRPQPRIAFGKYLSSFATSAIDISDGLIADLNHLLENSKIGAEINLDQIPFSEPVQQLLSDNEKIIGDLITGGDDYELLFTACRSQIDKIKEISQITNTIISPIGVVNESKAISFIGSRSKNLDNSKFTGYQHYIDVIS